MTLTEAQKKLQEIDDSRPAAYTSSYRDEMSSLRTTTTTSCSRITV